MEKSEDYRYPNQATAHVTGLLPSHCPLAPSPLLRPCQSLTRALSQPSSEWALPAPHLAERRAWAELTPPGPFLGKLSFSGAWGRCGKGSYRALLCALREDLTPPGLPENQRAGLSDPKRKPLDKVEGIWNPQTIILELGLQRACPEATSGVWLGGTLAGPPTLREGQEADVTVGALGLPRVPSSGPGHPAQTQCWSLRPVPLHRAQPKVLNLTTAVPLMTMPCTRL